MLFYRAALPLSSKTLNYVAGIVRRHRASIGSLWRKLNSGQQGLLVLVYLRKGETFAEVAAGFGVGTATAWRYVNETVDLVGLAHPVVLASAIVVIVVAAVSKLAGAFAGARIVGLTSREGWALGIGLNTRGVVEIVVATVGYQLGVLSSAMYTIVILVAITTSLMAPLMLRLVLADRTPPRRSFRRRTGLLRELQEVAQGRSCYRAFYRNVRWFLASSRLAGCGGGGTIVGRSRRCGPARRASAGRPPHRRRGAGPAPSGRPGSRCPPKASGSNTQRAMALSASSR